MFRDKATAGHITAIITVLFWGTTFISTKILLRDFTPTEILTIRFIAGYCALWAASPHFMKTSGWRQEIVFAGAGLTGITLYYLFENISLTYTLAANVGVIVAVSPFFTALLSWIFLKGRFPDFLFFTGFVLAMTGIYMISFKETQGMTLSPVGDMLAIGAALIWSIYSILIRMISGYGFNTIQATRRTFFYGIIFMIPVVCVQGFDVSPAEILKPVNLFNLCFLGFGASAACFVTWNVAVNLIGAVSTSIYIYVVPVITAITSVIVLGEKLNGWAVFGIVITLAGVFISEGRKYLNRRA